MVYCGVGWKFVCIYTYIHIKYLIRCGMYLSSYFFFFGLFYGDCEFSEKLLLNFFETSRIYARFLNACYSFFLINNLVSLSDLTLSFIDYQIESNIRLSIGDKNNNSIIWRNFKKKDFSSIIELKNGKRGEKLFEVITWSFECEDIVPGSYI